MRKVREFRQKWAEIKIFLPRVLALALWGEFRRRAWLARFLPKQDRLVLPQEGRSYNLKARAHATPDNAKVLAGDTSGCLPICR